MENIKRRDFLKIAGGILGGLAITSSIKGNEIGYSPKKDLASKTIENSEPVLEEIELTDERLKIIAERNWKMQQLSIWMEKNEERIFARAPNSELYAVGIWREEKPEIHYFNYKWEEALPFMKRTSPGVSNLIYRFQKDVILMF
mgnify:CR=1 FL=1